jgi:hypothetical protein
MKWIEMIIALPYAIVLIVVPLIWMRAPFSASHLIMSAFSDRYYPPIPSLSDIGNTGFQQVSPREYPRRKELLEKALTLVLWAGGLFVFGKGGFVASRDLTSAITRILGLELSPDTSVALAFMGMLVFLTWVFTSVETIAKWNYERLEKRYYPAQD